MNKKTAFTLAEVLITLTIIGVIAAITIPNLIQNYQEHATVNKVKKFYTTLTNAYAQAVKEYGPADEWNLNTSNVQDAEKIYERIFMPYFKIAKNCGVENLGNCFSDIYYKLLNGSNNSVKYTSNKYYKILLTDGTIITVRSGSSSADADYQAAINIDVNGNKPPNVIGVDMFAFMIRNDIVTPIGLPVGINAQESFNEHCANKTQATGWGCAAWLIYKGNMDYLHCNDLTWNGKNKCK